MEKLFCTDNFNRSPVVPIPPSFCLDGSLDVKSITNYINLLKDRGFVLFMTTAGTSQFNLLTAEEIHIFNRVCAEAAYPHAIILGIPPLANVLAKNEINKLSDLKNAAFMGFYPERYYNDVEVSNYFYDLADYSTKPIFFHGMPIKSGVGGPDCPYNSKLVNHIAAHKNIIGMKEESPSFEFGLDLCSKIHSKDFIIILAGKSQQRYLFMKAENPTTFLAGLGNIYPELEIKFWQLIIKGELEAAAEITESFERPLFDVFMLIGWHKALREALRQKSLACFYNRAPFGNTSSQESQKIKGVLDMIDNKIQGGAEI